jgi:hypothetical protein
MINCSRIPAKMLHVLHGRHAASDKIPGIDTNETKKKSFFEKRLYYFHRILGGYT